MGWSSVFMISLILLGSYLLERSCTREKRSRNADNLCAQCIVELKEGETQTLEGFTVCDRCYQRSTPPSTAEQLKKSLQWYGFVLVCGTAFTLGMMASTPWAGNLFRLVFFVGYPGYKCYAAVSGLRSKRGSIS